MKNIYDVLNNSKMYDETIERIELTDIEKRKIMKHITGKKYKERGTKKVAVAAAFAAVLVVGTSVNAAVKHFGILDYYANSTKNLPQEQVAKLVDTKVQQEPVASEVKEDALVDFHIREALCDNNQLVVEVEAVPTDPEHYILAPTDSDLEFPVTDLLIDGVTEGTVGEYAAAQDKEVLLVGAALHDERIMDNSLYFAKEEDGTLVIMITCGNMIKENNMNLTCMAYYTNANYSEDTVRRDIAFQVTDESNAQQFVYVPDDAVAADDIGGSMLDELVVNQTELTIEITTKWHMTKALSEGERLDDYTIDFHIYTEDGTRLEFMRDNGEGQTGRQLEDGTWELEQSDVYETINLSDTLVVEAYDYEKGEVVGEFVVHLKR